METMKRYFIVVARLNLFRSNCDHYLANQFHQKHSPTAPSSPDYKRLIVSPPHVVSP